MIYETEKFNAVYERSIDTHIKHGEQWGVPTHILRHDVVEAGFFNKPAYILGLIIEEMAKTYGKRAGWIVYVGVLSSLYALTDDLVSQVVRCGHNHLEFGCPLDALPATLRF